MVGRSFVNPEAKARQRFYARRLSAKSPIRHVDFQLLSVTLALCTFGIVAIYSATRPTLETLGEDPEFFLKRQIIFVGLGLGVFLAMMLFDYRQLRTLAPLLYGGGVLLLILVLTPVGESVSGAQRWIDFGMMQLQPSELMKVFLLIALATLLSDERVQPGIPQVAAAVGATGLPAILIFVQPDLGTLIALTTILGVVLLLSGARLRWLLAAGLAGVLVFVVILQLGLVRDYQVARLTAFLDADGDSQRAGYNLTQSKIAIGAGGFEGKGFFRGTQTNLDYVPEQHTDFIFTAIAEETGFRGSILLVALFALLAWRALRIATLSRDLFGTVLAGGVAGIVVFQVFINIGMTMGIMPITGIPLPFVSYGGSSLLTSFAAVGLLMNIHMRRFL